MSRTPTQPTSSSYEIARWIGCASGRAVMAGTAARQQARNPFMSVDPRANSLPSRRASRNGSLVHVCPSTGTVSVWPDRM